MTIQQQKYLPNDYYQAKPLYFKENGFLDLKDVPMDMSAHTHDDADFETRSIRGFGAAPSEIRENKSPDQDRSGHNLISLANETEISEMLPVKTAINEDDDQFYNKQVGLVEKQPIQNQFSFGKRDARMMKQISEQPVI